MKTFFKTTLLCTSLAMTLAACTVKETEIRYKDAPKADGQQDASSPQGQRTSIVANERMDSEELTAAGEQLIAVHSFHLAYKVFEKALEKDSENKKAQFYKIFLKRFMTLEGVLTRITPFVEKYGNNESHKKTQKELPKHPMRDFLIGKNKDLKPIKNLSEIQDVIADYRDAVNELRQFIAKNADMEMEIFLNPNIFMNQINAKMTESCVVKTIERNSETIAEVECDSSEIAMVKMNMTDLMVIKQYAAAEVLYLTLYTSYSLDGVAEIMKRHENSPISTEQFLNELQAFPGALKLNKRQALTQIRSLGSDFITAAKWAMKYQDSLCPKNSTGQPLKRKGYIVPNICVGSAETQEKSLVLFEQILAGPMQQKTDDGQTVTVNFMAILDKPIQDLNSVAPASFDAKGAPASWKDGSMGGLFPNGDFNEIQKRAQESAK